MHFWALSQKIRINMYFLRKEKRGWVREGDATPKSINKWRMAKSHQIVRKGKFLWTDKLLNIFFGFENKVKGEKKKKILPHTQISRCCKTILFGKGSRPRKVPECQGTLRITVQKMMAMAGVRAILLFGSGREVALGCGGTKQGKKCKGSRTGCLSKTGLEPPRRGLG